MHLFSYLMGAAGADTEEEMERNYYKYSNNIPH